MLGSVWPCVCRLVDATRQRFLCYQTILADQPAHAEANYGLATQLEHLGRFDEAAAKYRAALAADPDFAEASYGFGKLLARGNTLDEAVRCFLQAIDVDPEVY